MATQKQGVILVGHGGIPKGCPQELVTKLKRLEAQRRTAQLPPSSEELELDTKIRRGQGPRDRSLPSRPRSSSNTPSISTQGRPLCRGLQ